MGWDGSIAKGECELVAADQNPVSNVCWAFTQRSSVFFSELEALEMMQKQEIGHAARLTDRYAEREGDCRCGRGLAMNREGA